MVFFLIHQGKTDSYERDPNADIAINALLYIL